MKNHSTARPGIKIFQKLVRFAHSSYRGLALVAFIAMMTSGCASVPSMSHLDHLLNEQGDQITYLRTGSVFGVDFVTLRSTRQGELQVDPREAVDPHLPFDEKSISHESVDFTVLAHLHLLEHLHAFHEPLSHQLRQSLELIRARGIPRPDYSINILIRLVPLESGFDYQKTSYYFNRPTLEFVASVDIGSMERFEYSLISQLDTIHHELVHFSSDLGWIEVPGESLDERSINEEAFATIVGRCDGLTLFNNFHGDRPRLKYQSQYQEERFYPANLRASSDHSDLKLLGRIIGLETFLEEVPRDRYLESGEIQQMLDRCEVLSRQATDISKIYFERD